jgi:4-aminobutyrate aminotransferase-like enzyme
MLNAGLYARADDRQDSVITLAPPLTVGPAEFSEIRQMLESVLADGLNHI